MRPYFDTNNSAVKSNSKLAFDTRNSTAKSSATPSFHAQSSMAKSSAIENPYSSMDKSSAHNLLVAKELVLLINRMQKYHKSNAKFR